MTGAIDLGEKPLHRNGNGYIAVDTQTNNNAMPDYIVSRKVTLLEDIHGISAYNQKNKTYTAAISKVYTKFDFLAFLYQIIPVLKWLPKYPVKKQLVGDITSGITVAVMHIPQGMAYGILAGVTPSCGLYMAFFPTLVYFVFGSSRHISVGTLSIISLMTLNAVNKYANAPPSSLSLSPGNDSIPLDVAVDITEEAVQYFTPLQVVTATAFMCGVCQILMSIFRLGILSALFSDPLVNAFTTGAAVHVTVSQLKDLFGIKLTRFSGPFSIIYTVVEVCKALPTSNLVTVSISFSVIIFMVFMNEIVKPRSAKLCRFPIPAELLAVIGGTLSSIFLNLNENYKVHLVGDIPLGLPEPVVPSIPLLRIVAVDAIIISVIAYSVTISMGMILAQKRNYEVRPNQELLALGFSNIVGGFFSCVPNATSLSRSLIQEQTGGNTQLASVVSAMLILFILLYIGPFFEWLPRCVLSGIILVALKGMYVQASELKRFLREGAMETVTWIVTFIAVILVDVDIGLVFGIATSLLALYIKGWKAECALLGVVPGTDVYVDLRTHRKAEEIPQIKVFRYIGSINFASRVTFKKLLWKTIHLNFSARRRASLMVGEESKKFLGMQAVIIDFSNVTHIDVAACKTCTELKAEFEMINVTLLLAAPNDRVADALTHSQMLGKGPFIIFPTIHDAVLYAKSLANAENA